MSESLPHSSDRMENLGDLVTTLAEIRAEISKVIIGQRDVIDFCLAAIITNNHVLLEGVPGVAKTLLVKTLARSLGCEFRRIQFTPDMMPSDILGTNIFNMKTSEFHLVKGPVFTTFLLADEINRAPAKTQSALLQAMQERCVTIDRETLVLPPAFTVFATQNPVDYEGTYNLPEAQKDRFMIKVDMGYPDENEELTLARRMLGHGTAPDSETVVNSVRPVLTPEVLLRARQTLESLTLREEVLRYAVDIVRSSRQHESVLIGAGPRATQSLVLAARAAAILEGRDFVSPDDVKAMALPVLRHRIVLRPETEIEGLRAEDVVKRLLDRIPVPR